MLWYGFALFRDEAGNGETGNAYIKTLNLSQLKGFCTKEWLKTPASQCQGLLDILAKCQKESFLLKRAMLASQAKDVHIIFIDNLDEKLIGKQKISNFQYITYICRHCFKEDQMFAC